MINKQGGVMESVKFCCREFDKNVVRGMYDFDTYDGVDEDGNIKLAVTHAHYLNVYNNRKRVNYCSNCGKKIDHDMVTKEAPIWGEEQIESTKIRDDLSIVDKKIVDGKFEVYKFNNGMSMQVENESSVDSSEKVLKHVSWLINNIVSFSLYSVKTLVQADK